MLMKRQERNNVQKNRQWGQAAVTKATEMRFL